jgi:DnaJ-class molecular chaperone
VADEQVWGIGYGNKRHLIREGTRKDQGERKYGRDRYAVAACSSEIHLSFFSDGTHDGEGADVMKKAPCPRCAKKAGLHICPTCNGSGVTAEKIVGKVVSSG